MEGTILQALNGALAQTVPCEIIVSDDGSDDRGFELAAAVAAAYVGRHRLTVRRNECNQGLCRHIDTLSRVATGEIFVFMAADDVSYPQRVQRILSLFDEYADAYAVGSAVDEIDDQGNMLRQGVLAMESPMDQDRFLRCGKFATLVGASMAIRREFLIGLPPLQGMVEDNMLSLRASLFGRVFCLQEALLQYRLHGTNLGGWVYARHEDRRTSRRSRYERTARMYREIADDHARCLVALPQLTAAKRAIGEQVVEMYRIEADAREVVLNRPKSEWLAPIWRGLKHPGLRRKSLERALKLLLPRRLMGL
jgi:cellulose synthase/poly-beta-1,6-N-acetylglucosamine synthase-like glycosyltransferase